MAGGRATEAGGQRQEAQARSHRAGPRGKDRLQTQPDPMIVRREGTKTPE